MVVPGEGLFLVSEVPLHDYLHQSMLRELKRVQARPRLFLSNPQSRGKRHESP